jgi:hypothetical protein
MIAGNVNNPRTAMRHFQEPPDDFIMLVRPIPALTQAPAIDYVTNQIQCFTFDRVQKIAKQPSLTTGCAKVHVGYPDCAELHLRLIASRFGFVEPSRKLWYYFAPLNKLTCINIYATK